jgi:hypothetical protein
LKINPLKSKKKGVKALTNHDDVCHYSNRTSHAIGIPLKQHFPHLFYTPEIHLGRVFRNGSSFKKTGRVACDKCFCIVENESPWWEYNGFGAPANHGMQLCNYCYQNIMQDPLFLMNLITNPGLTVDMEARIAQTVELDFPNWYSMDEIVKDPETGCLIWKGRVNNDGYGIVHISGIDLFTHRTAYLGHLGNPECGDIKLMKIGTEVMHICDKVSTKARKPNRRCLNYKHLKAGTRSENMDAIKRANPTRKKKQHER